MKKTLLSFFILLFSLTVFAKKIQFSVDMSDYEISPNGVHVAGDFQAAAGLPGGDWQPNTATMINEAGTSIYSIVLDIPAFQKYEFKFINGVEWYEVEFVPEESRVGYNFNDNRWIYVDSTANDTTHTSAILFGGNAPANHLLVRFMVDMSLQETISPDGVHVAGNFQGWNIAKNRMYSFVDSIYEHIAFIPENNSELEFKYLNGNSVAAYETISGDCTNAESNRFFHLEDDTVLEVVCFAHCVPCNLVGIRTKAANKGFRIYPNPSSDWIVLQFDRPDQVLSVVIFDQFSRRIEEIIPFDSNPISFDFSTYSAGSYTIIVNFLNHSQSFTKFIRP